MNSYQQMYKKINGKFGEIITQSLDGGNGEQHAKISTFFDDYNKWIELVKKSNEEIIYKEANAEYKTMLLFLCMGLYKNAYMSLRGYFELTLFGILVSKCDMDFKLWKVGEKDVHWSEIIDMESGLFSEKYVKIYNPLLLDVRREMCSEAKCLYRTCSEYIHSGYMVTCKEIEVSFEQGVYEKICREVERINRIITYALCVRYGNELKKTGKITEFEECILEQLTDIKSIHDYLK